MTSILVAVSGTVGKQVFTSARPVELEYVLLTPSGANASVQIRDGNASGEVVFRATAPVSAGGSVQFDVCHKFTKGVHVKVLGTAAQAYLVIN